MSATIPADRHATDVTRPVRMRWDVIKKRAADVLRIPPEDVKPSHLADLFEVNRVSMWRFLKGDMVPSLDTALSMASVLGLRVEEIAEQVKP